MPAGRLNILNREDYNQFVPSPIEHYRTKQKIKSVRFKRISLDEKYQKLKAAKMNIDITNPEIYENNRKPIDGIFSPLFGADTTQDTPIYTCDCHALTGGNNLGRYCPNCKSYVRTIEADLRICGTIDIAPYHILSFHGYNAMLKVFKNLKEIITTTRKIDKSGKPKDNGLPTIMDLYDDYDELYAAKTGLPKEVAFMSKIPVYSARLRPLMRANTTVTLLEVNKYYLSLVQLSNIVRTSYMLPTVSRDIEIQRTLNQIQQDFNEITSIVVGQCNSKNGVFRRALASGRLDNSTRMVIALGEDLCAHEVDVPYQTMMIQYEEEIANFLSNKEDIPIAKAISMVQENQMKRDERFVKIIKQLLRSKKGIWILVNRNPTISKHGVIYCRIRKIHDDTKDMTLHLPQCVLAGLGADFNLEIKVHRSPIGSNPSKEKYCERLTIGVAIWLLTVRVR